MSGHPNPPAFLLISPQENEDINLDNGATYDAYADSRVAIDAMDFSIDGGGYQSADDLQNVSSATWRGWFTLDADNVTTLGQHTLQARATTVGKDKAFIYTGIRHFNRVSA